LNLPVVKNGLGALKCRVVGWVPLSGLGEAALGEIDLNGSRPKAESSGKQEGSILFIARLESVAIADENKEQTGKEEERIKPLVYENQRYVTTDV
jgi:hypothetical protein